MRKLGPLRLEHNQHHVSSHIPHTFIVSLSTLISLRQIKRPHPPTLSYKKNTSMDSSASQKLRSLTVAVIGAGAAGLCAARELLREGHKVVVFEKSDHIGGTWKYDPRTESDPIGNDPTREVVHSSLYLSLRTNLPRELMGFLDYPFPEDSENSDGRSFPGHEEVLWFLNKLADEFGIRDFIRFNRDVIRIERVNDRWVVESKACGCLVEEIFEAVVVCSGHFTEPRIAKIPGKFLDWHID